ncbi:MAG: RNA methyltransferase [Pirellulaceae bacterium]
MPLISIESIDDPRLAPYRDLRGAQTAEQMGLFVAEGRWLVWRLLHSRHRLHSVLAESQQVERVSDLLDDGIPLYVASRELIDRLVGFNFHRGIMACGYRPQAVRWQDLASRHQSVKLVVCSQISDRENLGGVVRNTAAFGCHGMVVGPACGDIFSRRVARVSMGTVFDMSVDFVDDLPESLRSMKHDFGIDVFATVLDESAESLQTVGASDRFALVFGNEGRGLEPALVAACHRRVTLPMSGGVDSLNVATSVGVFLYHFSNVGCAAASRGEGRERM